jgi:twinfilin-like protein
MSHSSGIPVSAQLRDAFGKAISGNVRMVKVQIENEELVSKSTVSVSGDFSSDLSHVPSLLDADTGLPCYILVKLDEETAQFVMLCYVPSKSKVKDKMLYASTRSNLKQQLGASYFVDEVFGDQASDFSAQGYKQHVESKKVEAPLTEREQLKQMENESGEIYSGGASTYVHGVAFPVDQGASSAVKQLISGQVQYIQIAIDCDQERIICPKTEGTMTFDKLRSEIPLDEPRFHFFAYKHDHQGASVTSFVYVYSCPDGSNGSKSAPVRMRMLYSSSKANVAEVVKAAGGQIDARLEVNTGSELNEEELLSTLHPQKAEQAKNFARPSRPGKGGARLIKK